MLFLRKDEPVISCGEKVKLFLSVHWRGLVCFLTPLICLPIILPLPAAKHLWCGYCLIIMAVYWVSECIPLPVTSFFPIIIFPLSGIMSTMSTCSAYYNDTIFMFLGSLILASCVEQSGLHLRIALFAIKTIGYSHYKLLFAMCFITMFISMWITNTAATTMMVPINFALMRVFEGQGLLKIYDTMPDGEKEASDMTACYFCAITYSATIGGIGTLVGTATNLVFKGLFMSAYPDAKEYLSFPLFSAFAIPYMLLMEIACYLCMILVYFGFLRPSSAAAKKTVIPPKAIKAAEAVVTADRKKLGTISFWEIMVLILFGGAMIGFFARSPQIFVGWGDHLQNFFKLEQKHFVKDSAAAMFVCFLMFLLPSSLQFCRNFRAKYKEQLSKGRIRSVLDWKLCHESLPWSFVFLLGGGFALSTAAKEENSNLNEKIGLFLKMLKDLPNMAVLLIIIIFTVFVTNFASNVAICNVIVPIVMQLAKEISSNPLWYNISAGFSASYCYCLPVGTPGNLVVQSAAKVSTKKMIIAGAGPTLTTIILTWLSMCFYAPIIWPDLKTMPEWASKSYSNKTL